MESQFSRAGEDGSTYTKLGAVVAILVRASDYHLVGLWSESIDYYEACFRAQSWRRRLKPHWTCRSDFGSPESVKIEGLILGIEFYNS